MLNRRILRIKVMQNFYAFYQCMQSNIHNILDEISDRIKQDQAEISKKELDAILETIRHYFAGASALPEEFAYSDLAESFANELSNQNATDQKRFKTQLKNEAQQIYQLYLKVLRIPDQLLQVAIQLEEKKGRQPNNLRENKVIQALNNSQKIQQEFQAYPLTWKDEIENFRIWVKDILFKDEQYQTYMLLEHPDAQADREFILYLIKKILFKNPTITSYLEEHDICWQENKDVLRSMVSWTIRDINSATDEPPLAILSINWEDDQQFLLELFDQIMAHHEQYDQLVVKHSKNWDIQRIALIDHIIIKLAICEMLLFPSIPVKVTINEYIEMAKKYSTPKSRQFVNGILHVIHKQLEEEGAIKKSGKGLIDNK